MVERLIAFIERHPRLFDGFIAFFWLMISFGDSAVWDDESHVTMSVVGFTVAGVVLFWRRRFPLHVFGVQGLVVIIMAVIDADSPVPIALLLGTYSLAAYVSERRFSIAAFTAFIVAGFASVLFTSPEYIPDALFIVLTLNIAWVIGDSLRTRRAYQQSVLERAERAEALRDSLAHQAVAEERTRIARDLHDVVAHSMSLMVVQAGAARRVAQSDPEASVAAIEAIEAVGRSSLDEMRRILDVLRGEDDGITTAPQPNIAAIEPLAEEFRTAGLPVEVRYTGAVRPLAPSVELTAFRIVQESLTNTLKHAGPASATVDLDFDDSNLCIVVQDDGRTSVAAPVAEVGSQRGHIGMRERVAAFGGFFTAQPRLQGGYYVSATLPLTETPATLRARP